MRIFIWLLCLLWATLLTAGEIDLDHLTVVKPESSSPVMLRAYQELVETLNQITGNPPGDKTRKITLTIDSRLAPDGFRITTENGNLQIAGGHNYGILYGVYAVLEDDLGCRWYEPGITFIPRYKSWQGIIKDRTEVPAFPVVRDPFSALEINADWALHNRVIRMINNNLPPELGNRITFPQVKGEFWLCHTTHYFCPNSLFAVHPEYFMVDADGRHSPDQICPCNATVRQLAAQKILATLDQNPKADYITLSMEDNLKYCHCPKCTAINRREGTDGAAFWELANQVAAEMAQKHPEVKLIVLAYYATFAPPRHMKLANNITIMYADINRPRMVPAAQGKNKQYLETWCRIAQAIIIWDYQADFTDFYRYVPSLRAVAQNLAYYQQFPQIKGVAVQGAYKNWGGARQGLRAWVEAKLLWNPRLDYQKLTADYVQGVYGTAAPPIEKFYRYLDDWERRQGAGAAAYGEVIAYGKKCFTDARQRAAEDPVILDRLDVAELPIWFYELDRLYALRYCNELTPEKRRQALQLIDRIAAVTKEHHFSIRSEKPDGIIDMDKYRHALSMPIPYIPGTISSQSIVIPATEGLCCMGAKNVADVHAAWPQVVRQPSGMAWNWQLRLDNQNIPAGKYRIRIRDRIEKTGNKMDRILYGTYDAATKSTRTLFLDPKSLDHPDYRWHELATLRITPNTTLWIMINPQSNTFIHYIDSIELVPEKTK